MLTLAFVARGAGTGLCRMVLVFPGLGLSSGRAFRDLVAPDGMLAPDAGLSAD